MLRYLYIDKDDNIEEKPGKYCRELFLSANVHQGDELLVFNLEVNNVRLLVYRQHTNNVRSYPTARASSAWSQSTFILLMPWYKETDIVHESSE